MHSLRIARLMKILFIGITICLSVGCLHENRSGCGNGLLLKFRYVTSIGLLRAGSFPETDHLSVFAFDRDGLFVCEKKDSAIRIDDNYTMEFPLSQGQYQFVVWSGLSDSYTLTPRFPGQTRIQDFILKVKRDDANNIPSPPPLLYHGHHETISLDPSATEVITIGLRRITNTVRVIVHTPNPVSQPQISIRDNNGAYSHLGTTVPDTPVNYLPRIASSPNDPTTWIAGFNVMQLQTTGETRLYIDSPDDGLQYNEKLVSGLLAANPDIDFNTDHDFTIEITFNDLYVPVSILINDWEIIPEDIN